jgi:dolichol-phosphate mannosyltransferase
MTDKIFPDKMLNEIASASKHIIPTYNEKDNVAAIAARIGGVNGLGEYEIVFIDDSMDDTPDYLERLSQENKHVRYEHRVGIRGLAKAVVRDGA